MSLYNHDVNPRYSYQALFSVLVLAMLIPAFLYKNPALNIIFNIFISVIVLTAIYSLAIRRFFFIITLILAALTTMTTWVEISSNSTVTNALDHGLNFIFFAYLALLLAVRVFRTTHITGDTVFGALSIYLLIGYTFGFVYLTMDTLQPAAFDIGDHTVDTSTYIYYSFVTLTTLGFGDIVPKTPPAQILSIIEAVTGQFFLAVIVARFVGIIAAERRAALTPAQQRSQNTANDAAP